MFTRFPVKLSPRFASLLFLPPCIRVYIPRTESSSSKDNLQITFNSLWAKMQIWVYEKWVCDCLLKISWVSNRTWSPEGLCAGRTQCPRCLAHSSVSCSLTFLTSIVHPWNQGTNFHLWFPLPFFPLAMILLSWLFATCWILMCGETQTWHMLLEGAAGIRERAGPLRWREGVFPPLQ